MTYKPTQLILMPMVRKCETTVWQKVTFQMKMNIISNLFSVTFTFFFLS